MRFAKSIIYSIAILTVIVLIPELKGNAYQSSVSLSGISPQYEVYATSMPDFKGFGFGLQIAVDTNRVLTPTSYTVGNPHLWFNVEEGTAFDSAYVSTATPFANPITQDLSGQRQLALGESFLLGFWLETFEQNSVIGQGGRFGWARLVYTESGLILLDNAIDDSGAGIIAGTTTAIPEPGYSLYGSIVLLILLIYRCRNRSGYIQRTPWQ